MNTRIQGYKNTSIQIIQAYTNTRRQEGNHTGIREVREIQEYNNTSTQAYKHTSIQEHRDRAIQEYTYARIQENRKTRVQ